MAGFGDGEATVLHGPHRRCRAAPGSNSRLRRAWWGGEVPSSMRFYGGIWGSGHAVAPPSILQNPEESRRKDHLYSGKKWLFVDESRPKIGIEAGVFALFVSGGELCLRGTTRRGPTSPCGRNAVKDGVWIPTTRRAPLAPQCLHTADG